MPRLSSPAGPAPSGVADGSGWRGGRARGGARDHRRRPASSRPSRRWAWWRSAWWPSSASSSAVAGDVQGQLLGACRRRRDHRQLDGRPRADLDDSEPCPAATTTAPWSIALPRPRPAIARRRDGGACDRCDRSAIGCRPKPIAHVDLDSSAKAHDAIGAIGCFLFRKKRSNSEDSQCARSLRINLSQFRTERGAIPNRSAKSSIESSPRRYAPSTLAQVDAVRPHEPPSRRGMARSGAGSGSDRGSVSCSWATTTGPRSTLGGGPASAGRFRRASGLGGAEVPVDPARRTRPRPQATSTLAPLTFGGQINDGRRATVGLVAYQP